MCTEQKKLFTIMKPNAPYLKRALWETYKHKCLYCGKELMSKEMQIDHIWPQNEQEKFLDEELKMLKEELILRGFVEDTLENFAVSCTDCNRKKGNEPLGNSNLRFYFWHSFRYRDKVLKKIEKYKYEISDENAETKQDDNGSEVENKELIREKQIINTMTSSFYTYGKGHACINAFIPMDYDEKISCCINTEELDKIGITYTLNSQDIKKYLFDHCGESILEKRIWCEKLEGREGRENYWIILPNIRLDASYEEVKELADIIDDLFEEYLLQQSRLRDILGTNYFTCKELKKVPILKVSSNLWNEMVSFSKRHTCDRQISEWNIFNLNSGVNEIQICKNDNEEYIQRYNNFSVGLVARFTGENEGDMKCIYWRPGYGAIESNKMQHFDNVMKWKADFAHDWLLYKLIPHILFSKLKMINRVKYLSYDNKRFINDYIVNNRQIISCKNGF